LNRDFLWVAGGRLVSALAALVAIRVATTLLSPNEYGLWAVLVTFQVFCGLFLVNPVGQYINRHTHEWGDQGVLHSKLRRFKVYVLFASSAGALAAGVWGCFQPFSPVELLIHMAAVFLMVLCATWNATYVVLLNMFGSRAWSVFWGTATLVFGLAFASLLVGFHSGGLVWFTGHALGMAAGAVGARYVFARSVPTPTSEQPKYQSFFAPGDLKTYVLPLALATGFMWWLVSGYRLMIEQYWGLAALGAMAVGLTLATQLWGLFESLCMQFLFPLYYRRIASANKAQGAQAFSDLLNALGPLYLVLAAATVACAPSLLILFVSAQYANVVVFLQLGALFEFCRVGANLLGSAAQVERNMQSLILPYAVGATLLLLGLLVAADQRYTPQQAVYVVAAAGALMFAVMVWRMRVQLPFTFDLLRWTLAFLLLPLSLGLAQYGPENSGSWLAAALHVAVVGAVCAVCMFALLWKNPALVRLLQVRLR
jgi:O-antigen/teichoic acid export membrane protein